MGYTMTNCSLHLQDSAQLLGLALLYKALSLLCPKELNYTEAIWLLVSKGRHNCNEVKAWSECC